MKVIRTDPRPMSASLNLITRRSVRTDFARVDFVSRFVRVFKIFKIDRGKMDLHYILSWSESFQTSLFRLKLQHRKYVKTSLPLSNKFFQ